MNNIQNLYVDLDLKQNLNIYATCKQLDNLNLICSIYNNSVQADLTNYNVRLKALKADKVPLIQETAITIDNNVVNIEAHEQLTTTSGKTLIELQFIDKTTGKKNATFNLVLNVVPSTIEVNKGISTSTYTLLEELENKLDQATDFLGNINVAIEANSTLENTINESAIAKNNLNADILSADTLNDDLESNITSGTILNDDLESNITLSVTAKDDLHAENVQAQANREALAALGDVTELAQTANETKTEVTVARGTYADLKARLDHGDAQLSDIEQQQTTNTQNIATNTNAINTINSSLSSLGANDLAAREEIMDIKLKLKEQSSINFINKTGVGFYDTFIDNSNIDTITSTSVLNTINKAIDFQGQKFLKMKDETFDTFNNLDVALYPAKINKATVSGAVNNSNTVVISSSDKALSAGDKLFMNNLLNEVLSSTLNSTTYDRTTPVSVVNSVYSPSNNAKPQILSNGWIVTCVFDSTNLYVKFYVSKDDGASFTLLTQWGVNAAYGLAICSKDNIIYGIATSTSTTSVPLIKFDATTVGSTVTSSVNIATYQGSFGNGCSIAVSSTGVLTAVWSSLNTTYVNSYNISGAKSTDGGLTWVKQNGANGIDFISPSNTTGYNNTKPSIIYDKNDNPVIVLLYDNTATHYIASYTWNGTTWTIIYMYNSGNIGYYQSNPTILLQKYGTNAGRIWVAWGGIDNTDTAIYNIRISYSDDNGVTWSTSIKLTSGNTYNQYFPSIGSNLNGDVYVVWYGITSTNTAKSNIRMIKYNGTSWSSITEITNQNTANMNTCVVCDNYYNFESPIFIWLDNVNNRISFYGKWTAGGGYTLTMQNSVTLSNNQQILIIDLIPQQNNVDMTIDSVTDASEKKITFKATNLSATVAKIKVNGKDNSLNALAYAIA